MVDKTFKHFKDESRSEYQWDACVWFIFKELVLDVGGHRAAPIVCRADRYIDFVILLLNGNSVLHKYQVQHGRSTLTKHLRNC